MWHILVFAVVGPNLTFLELGGEGEVFVTGAAWRTQIEKPLR